MGRHKDGYVWVECMRVHPCGDGDWLGVEICGTGKNGKTVVKTFSPEQLSQLPYAQKKDWVATRRLMKALGNLEIR